MRLFDAHAGYVCLLFFFLFRTVKLHFYTAVSDLEELIVTEENVLNSLDLYLETEEERLQQLKRKREQFGRVHELAKRNVEQFLWNPVNAYLLIKRLTTDLYETYQLVESSYTKDLFRKEASQVMIYPEESDLIGAADALIRLQEFYSLNTLDMARGQIAGATLSAELTVADCFILGRRAYEIKKWQQALFWLQESLNILENEGNASASHKIEILGHMANVHNSIKNYTAAAEVSEDILKLDPNHVQAKANLKFYRTLEASMEAPIDETWEDSIHDEQATKAMNAYSTLCRGEKIKTSNEKPQLHCYFASKNSGYFLLQPSKVEVLNFEPLLVMYHDVLRDGEAEILKALAYPKFAESPIPIRSSEKIQCSRISKSAFFQDSEHSVVKTISRKLQDIIGTNSHPDLPLEVVNFGTGGHYEPHLDFEPMSEQQVDSQMGYPLATWMVYLSDVISGGSTVFTEIGVEIKPKKII
nr:prolyl 4-hydroxylase subunit alpha-1-like [Parasteatoda tepidariorum]